MKRIVYLNEGVLVVCTPVINTHPEPENLTEDEAVARAMAKLPAGAVDVRVLPESAIPATRAHRALWTYNAGKTAVIVPAAPAAAADAEKTRRADVEAAIAGDAVLNQLKGATRAGIDDYFASNVTTVAQAITHLKRLTYVMVRRVL